MNYTVAPQVVSMEGFFVVEQELRFPSGLLVLAWLLAITAGGGQLMAQQQASNGPSAPGGSALLPQAPSGPAPAPADNSLSVEAGAGELHIQKGFDLACRGAVYSAREEFIRALELTGHARDAMAPAPQYHDAILEGLTALEEVDDFMDANPLTANSDLAGAIAAHRTTVLKEADPSQLTPIVVARRYCAFAQDRLVHGCGNSPTASRALYGLARIEMCLAGTSGERRLGCPKAMAVLETALRVDPQNYRAANELGVLLARYGQYQPAIACLQRSVRACPTAEAWYNLSVACRAVGDLPQAQHAASQHQELSRPDPAIALKKGGVEVRWVDQATFVAKSPPDTVHRPAGPGSVSRPEKAGSPASERPPTQPQAPRTGPLMGLEKVKSRLQSILR